MAQARGGSAGLESKQTQIAKEDEEEEEYVRIRLIPNWGIRGFSLWIDLAKC